MWLACRMVPVALTLADLNQKRLTTMANDRNDFDPSVRNGAWWSGDSRMAATGRANEAIMQKLGLVDRPDLSDVEAVQMGHTMQPVIGQLVTSRLGLELQDADYSLTHPKETWLKRHYCRQGYYKTRL